MSVLARRQVTRCLGGDEISEYVERALSRAELLHWDRHLVVCVRCQGAVEAERRMMASLRGREPSLPGDLHAALLSLASVAPSAPARSSHHRRAPVESPRTVPVPVLSPSAPACHRSALRSAVFATLAAGASAAAAWSLAMTGAAPAGPALQNGPPTGRLPQPVVGGGLSMIDSATPVLVTGHGSSSVWDGGTGAGAMSAVLVRTSRSGPLSHGAESTP